MLLGISQGTGQISGFLRGADCMNTIACFRQLGVDVEDSGTEIIVRGHSLRGLRKPESVLNVSNSGTTIRLISGILAGQDFTSIVTGDQSIRRRPMDRIIVPLLQMGAMIEGEGGGNLAPLVIHGGDLTAIDYTLPVASAQVKSAILLAGLYADGQTIVREQFPSRNHTELMLEFLGAEISWADGVITIASSELMAREIQVPGDLSSAAFFLATAAAIPGSHLLIENVGLNPTRTGIIDVLRAMGALIELENLRKNGGEEVGDIVVRGKRLHGTNIGRGIIPRLVDEIPILTVIAGVAEGTTKITGAEELRHKESNRLTALVTELSKLGIRVRELPDGVEIDGPNQVLGGQVESYGDHRVAMALACAGLFAQNPVRIRGSECIAVSFPGFHRTLKNIVI